MHFLKRFLFIGLLACLAGCSTCPRAAFWADDKALAEQIAGRWIKDETYYYGRFIGVLTLEKDGRCTREFGVYREENNTLTPLHIARGRWRIEKGYILFYDSEVEGLEPGKPDFHRIERASDQREWVMQLNPTELMTVDVRNKIDAYRAAE